ncbi:MAG: divergent polysaccharide deacetylase family protein [Candidatus Marinimicrobia bacterium]|nr:divergent polysaccharide deacetylase family protein [Candidatus Neomarinimicrobiota bacterium]
MSNIKYLQPDNNKVEHIHKQKLLLSIVFVLIICAIVYFFYYRLQIETSNHKQYTNITLSRLEKIIADELPNFNLKRIKLTTPDNNPNQIVFQYSSRNVKKQLLLSLESKLQTAGFYFLKKACLPRGCGFVLTVTNNSDSNFNLYFISKNKINILKSYLNRILSKPPRLAIIVNNFGYSKDSVFKDILTLPADLTIAITPGNSYSEWAEQVAFQAGKEVIIHMPMAAQNQNLGQAEKLLISKEMSKNKVQKHLKMAIEEIPSAFGMDNYMGSAATSSPKLMNIVFNYLQKQGLYFIDNLNTLDSKAYDYAKSKGLPAAVRNVFINNQNTTETIENNLEQAVKVARKQGKAIAVARANPKTLKALRKLINSQQINNVKLCFASEIVS